jgi:hypothetical protein
MKKTFLGTTARFAMQFGFVMVKTEPEDIKLDADQFQELFSNP